MKRPDEKSPPSPPFSKGGEFPSPHFSKEGELRVREAVAKDRDAIRAVIDAAGNLTDDEQACALELFDIYIKDAEQRDYSFIAAVDAKDMVAGYACYGPRPLTEGTFDLYWIIVAPSMRRWGAGRLLVESVDARLASQGARLLVAETSGLAKYESTRRFYTGCGFTEEARVKEFYRPEDDLVIYTKRLQPNRQRESGV